MATTRVGAAGVLRGMARRQGREDLLFLYIADFHGGKSAFKDITARFGVCARSGQQLKQRHAKINSQEVSISETV
jgi:hypothetical protein